MTMLKKTVSLALSAVLLLCALLLTAQAAPIPGDVDGDGSVKPGDARLALRASVRLESYEFGSPAFLAADANGDGEIKPEDARSILRASVGLETLPEIRPAADECAILRGGSFCLRGRVTDGDGQSCPLALAVSPEGVYTLSSVDGEPVGVLMKDGKTFLISPRHQAYLTLSDAMLEAIGAGDLSNVPTAADFACDPALADRTETVTVNGVACTEYVFETADGGVRRIVTDEGRLLRISVEAADGTTETVQEIDYVTGRVPASLLTVPESYEEYRGLTGLFAFAQLLGDPQEG